MLWHFSERREIPPVKRILPELSWGPSSLWYGIVSQNLWHFSEWNSTGLFPKVMNCCQMDIPALQYSPENCHPGLFCWKFCQPRTQWHFKVKNATGFFKGKTAGKCILCLTYCTQTVPSQTSVLRNATLRLWHHPISVLDTTSIHQRMNANGFLLPNYLFSWNK
jgi:hypothetical protein